MKHARHHWNKTSSKEKQGDARDVNARNIIKNAQMMNVVVVLSWHVLGAAVLALAQQKKFQDVFKAVLPKRSSVWKDHVLAK